MWSGKAFSMFLEECRSTADRLADFQSETGSADLIQLVHRLRGSAGFFGQKQLQEVCKHLEQALKAGKTGNEIAPMVQEVRSLALRCSEQSPTT
ncbi:MAG: Hpt domain-containing protein [Bdellovibrionota bacterium]|nr:MAG: Hpt domain-containing protein [Bdellovibrionota bacterium]